MKHYHIDIITIISFTFISHYDTFISFAPLSFHMLRHYHHFHIIITHYHYDTLFAVQPLRYLQVSRRKRADIIIIDDASRRQNIILCRERVFMAHHFIIISRERGERKRDFPQAECITARNIIIDAISRVIIICGSAFQRREMSICAGESISSLMQHSLLSFHFIISCFMQRKTLLR